MANRLLTPGLIISTLGVIMVKDKIVSVKPSPGLTTLKSILAGLGTLFPISYLNLAETT